VIVRVHFASMAKLVGASMMVVQGISDSAIANHCINAYGTSNCQTAVALLWPSLVEIVVQKDTTATRLTVGCGKSMTTGIQNVLTAVHMIVLAMPDVR